MPFSRGKNRFLCLLQKNKESKAKKKKETKKKQKENKEG